MSYKSKISNNKFHNNIIVHGCTDCTGTCIAACTGMCGDGCLTVCAVGCSFSCSAKCKETVGVDPTIME